MHPPDLEFVPPSPPPAVPVDADAATLPPTARRESASALTYDFPPAGPPVTGLPRLPGYEILDELGRGGMGVVYRARHLGLNRVVAVKMILAGSFADDRLLTRFKAEAEVLARLQHPHIVQVYDIGTYEGKTYFTLEYIAGGSLDQHLHATPQPPLDAAALIAQLADGIHAAHEQGIVHRDLKPGNVLLLFSRAPEAREGGSTAIDADSIARAFGARLNDSTPKITDFGLAKQTSSHLTATGVIMGTPSYMAPEQAEAKREVGPAADIYALGAILYEMLTGRAPFVATTPLDTVMQVLNNDPVPPTKLQPKVPRDLETICLKCLHKDPVKRYATAADLAADLRRLLSDEPILARPVGNLERAVKWAKRRPTVAGLLATLVVVVLAAIGGLAALWWEADTQRLLAVDAQAEAERQKNEALTQQKLAQQRAAALNERLYAVDMVQLHDAWELAELSRLRRQLDQYQKSPLRGFEWHYYHWLLNRTGSMQLAPLGSIPFIVQSVAYHPDGVHLAVAGYGNEVQIWNTQTRTLVRRLPMKAAVLQVEYMAQGRVLVAACAGELQVWNPATGEQLRTLKVSDQPLARFSLSEDGNKILVVDEGGQFSVWDLPRGRLLRRRANRRFQAVLSPDGEHIAVNAANNVFLARTNDDDPRGFTLIRKDLRHYFHHLKTVSLLAFNPDGDRLAIAGLDSNDNSSVRIFEADSTQEVCRCGGGMKNIRCLAFSPDGKWLATASEDNAIRLWDATTGKEVRRFRGQGYLYNALAFTRDGKHLAAGSSFARVELWPLDLVQEAEVYLPSVGNVGASQLLHPDGRHALFLPAFTYTLEQVALDGKHRQKIRLRTGDMGQLCYSPDGRFLALGFRTGEVRLVDARTGQLLHSCTGLTTAHRDLAFSRDGEVLAAVDSADRPNALPTIQLWHTGTGRPLARLENLPELQHLSRLALGPQGKTLVTGHINLACHLWNVADRKVVTTFAPPQNSYTSHLVIALDPQGRYVATALPVGEIGSNTALVYDVATGQQRFLLAGHAKPITHLAFSPDGLRLATGSGDGSVRLWDLRTGQEVLRLRIPEERLIDLLFAADGQRLLALGRTNWVRAWPTHRP